MAQCVATLSQRFIHLFEWGKPLALHTYDEAGRKQQQGGIMGADAATALERKNTCSKNILLHKNNCCGITVML